MTDRSQNLRLMLLQHAGINLDEPRQIARVAPSSSEAPAPDRDRICALLREAGCSAAQLAWMVPSCPSVAAAIEYHDQAIERRNAELARKKETTVPNPSSATSSTSKEVARLERKLDFASTAIAKLAAFLRPGMPVWYEATLGGQKYAAVVDDDPRELGPGQWCVRLRELDASYVAMHPAGRDSVPAAAVWCLSPRETHGNVIAELKKLLDRCPIGWHEGKVVLHRATTDSDIIAWVGKLNELASDANDLLPSINEDVGRALGPMTKLDNAATVFANQVLDRVADEYFERHGEPEPAAEPARHHPIDCPESGSCPACDPEIESVDTEPDDHGTTEAPAVTPEEPTDP